MKNRIKALARYLASEGFYKEAYVLSKLAFEGDGSGEDSRVAAFNSLFEEMIKDPAISNKIKQVNKSGLLTKEDQKDAINQAYIRVRSSMDKDPDLEPGRGYILVALESSMVDIYRREILRRFPGNRANLFEATYTDAANAGYGRGDPSVVQNIFLEEMRDAAETGSSFPGKPLINDLLLRLIDLESNHPIEWFEMLLKEFPKEPGHAEYWYLKNELSEKPEDLALRERFHKQKRLLQDRYHKRLQRYQAWMRLAGGPERHDDPMS